MNLHLIQAKHWLQSIAFRSKEEQHTEHADNALDELIRLENRDRQLVQMLNDKERELILRASKIRNLESELLTLKNELGGLEMAVGTLEEVNKKLIKQLEDKF